MKRLLVVTATALSALALFGGGAYYYSATQQEVAAAVVAPADTLVRPHSPVLGKVEAPVTIVEFFDPSCEACRAFFPLVKNILATYPDDVRVVLRYTPFHEGSDEAVRILEAARNQNKFEPVLAALMQRQPEWAVDGQPDLKKAWAIAGDAGLELMGARLYSVKPEVEQVLQADTADVKSNNVQQTPTFFVNGKPLVNFGPQGLMDLVKSEVDKSKGS
ncbi:DsbA family protein [Rhizobium metallidurans]|uniref:Protein-disulfide isomerase n=1 Tax=Rhizobium metallidurans TaxID=1265931 RepID=A0A7W6GBU4_9HYPH|nr:thioredoxin domain-containing protein [Rhizobium metallidurans]MBB3965412.1 protein-disulfide isomerase [Rhizobium metallidurans]